MPFSPLGKTLCECDGETEIDFFPFPYLPDLFTARLPPLIWGGMCRVNVKCLFSILQLASPLHFFDGGDGFFSDLCGGGEFN